MRCNPYIYVRNGPFKGGGAAAADGGIRRRSAAAVRGSRLLGGARSPPGGQGRSYKSSRGGTPRVSWWEDTEQSRWADDAPEALRSNIRLSNIVPKQHQSHCGIV